MFSLLYRNFASRRQSPRNLALHQATITVLTNGKGRAGEKRPFDAGQSSDRNPPSGAIPRMNDCGSVAVVLEAHAAHGPKMKPTDLSACWNRIGKLASNRREQQWLRQNLKALGPLFDQTKRDIGRLSARPLATAAHGLAKVAAATGWKPGSDIWKLVEKRGLRVVTEFDPQALANTAWAFATAGHAAPELFDAVAKAAAPRLVEFTPGRV